MATLAEAKTLGGVGAILLVLGFIPFLGIIGFILILIAVKYISDVANDRSVFDNMLYAAIMAIIGIVVVSVLVLLPLFGLGIIDGGTIDPNDPLAIFALGVIFIGLVVVWIFAIISSVFLRRSFDSTATHVGIPLFATAGLLYFIGAILIIVFFVGFILIFIAEIIMIVAFFSLPDQLPAAPMAQPPPPA